MGGHARIGDMSDAEPSSELRPAATGPAFSADDLVRLTGGQLLAR